MWAPVGHRERAGTVRRRARDRAPVASARKSQQNIAMPTLLAVAAPAFLG
jgi:hypothetical protein